MARVPYLDRADLPADYRYLFDQNELGTLNIFRALGNEPSVLQSYMRFGTTLWEQPGLDRRDVELVVLTVASELDAEYEWHQHVPIGLDAGLTVETIRAIREGNHSLFADRDRRLVEYASAYVRGAVDDELHERLRAIVDNGTIVGIAMLAGFYLATARTLNAVAVAPETEFVGWDLEGL